MRILLILLIGVGHATMLAQQQPEPARVQAAGTASLAGVVVTDESPTRPARRAQVTLEEVSGSFGRSTIADDDGRFVFEDLRPGRFLVSASKGGYVTSRLGATRPGGAGIPVAVTAGRRIIDIVVTIVRGGVITGTLRDQKGSPVQATRVWATGPGAHVDRMHGLANPALGASSLTDDHGVYRIFGLIPREYLVWAEGPFGIEESVTRLTTPEDLQRAQQAIQTGSGTAGSRTAPAVKYADSYYTNATSSQDAVPIRVGPGEERAGIDLTLLLVPTARLSGVVLDPSGRPAKSVRVWMRPAIPTGNRQQFEMRPGPAGTFVAPHVMPGSYMIGAEAPIDAAGNAAVARQRPDRPREWSGRLAVTVNGMDQADLKVRLLPGVDVSGRVSFEGDQTRQVAALNIKLLEADELDAGADNFYYVPDTNTNADGSFLFETVAADKYRFVIKPPAGSTLKSITAADGTGLDWADLPLEVKDADVAGLAITFTSRTTELTGRLQDASGRPAPLYTIVAFSADRLFWTPRSRRIQVTRPADDGVFSLRNLPPGKYLVAALTDIEDGQWFEAGFLSTLVSAGVAVTIVDGQRTVQDLRILK